MTNFIPFAIIGALVAASLFAFILWLRNRDIKVTWYEWLIGVIGLLILLMGLQHYFGAVVENFSYAAWMGLLIVGGIGVILMAVAWSLIARRR